MITVETDMLDVMYKLKPLKEGFDLHFPTHARTDPSGSLVKFTGDISDKQYKRMNAAGRFTWNPTLSRFDVEYLFFGVGQSNELAGHDGDFVARTVPLVGIDLNKKRHVFEGQFNNLMISRRLTKNGVSVIDYRFRNMDAQGDVIDVNPRMSPIVIGSLASFHLDAVVSNKVSALIESGLILPSSTE
ncbi:MAG: hypothetical protein ACI9T8_000095 [Candidatus Saccharimonadales bacterium]|jgi:hypothetical protein